MCFQCCGRSFVKARLCFNMTRILVHKATSGFPHVVLMNQPAQTSHLNPIQHLVDEPSGTPTVNLFPTLLCHSKCKKDLTKILLKSFQNLTERVHIFGHVYLLMFLSGQLAHLPISFCLKPLNPLTLVVKHETEILPLSQSKIASYNLQGVQNHQHNQPRLV